MGQDISKSIIPPPLTLQDCFVNGQINLARYLYYRRRSNHLMHAISGDRKLLKKKRKYNHLDFIQNKKQKKLRSTKKYKSMVRDRDGVLRELLPTDTLWYLLYISIPPNTPRMLKLFRRRFRLPYDTFLTLSNEISTNPMFARWNRCDAVGVKPSDRKLLLLGVLRYIGRAWTLDDVAEANGISLFVNRDFCYVFWNMEVLFYTKNGFLILHQISILVKENQYFGRLDLMDALVLQMLPILLCCHVHIGLKTCIKVSSYIVQLGHIMLL